MTWCHDCGWNVVPPPQEAPRSAGQRFYAAAGRRLGVRMARELADAEELGPRLTAGKVAAYAIAFAVHLLTLGFLAGGALLIALAPTNIFAILVGVVLIAIAMIMRPRLGKVPKAIS
jgi:hypothetical protein